MKKLHLIRHAKSSWSSGALADIDRPLNQRGLKSCTLMAEKIVQAGCTFEHVFCSSAVRAQSTIENLTAALQETTSGKNSDSVAYRLGKTKDVAPPQANAPSKEGRSILWKVDPALYTFVMKDLLVWCQQLDDTLSDVVIVGHNSALTDFVNAVGNQRLDNVPTCGYVQLVLKIEQWQALSPGTGEMVSFLKPKMFSAETNIQ